MAGSSGPDGNNTLTQRSRNDHCRSMGDSTLGGFAHLLPAQAELNRSALASHYYNMLHGGWENGRSYFIQGSWWLMSCHKPNRRILILHMRRVTHQRKQKGVAQQPGDYNVNETIAFDVFFSAARLFPLSGTLKRRQCATFGAGKSRLDPKANTRRQADAEKILKLTKQA